MVFPVTGARRSSGGSGPVRPRRWRAGGGPTEAGHGLEGPGQRLSGGGQRATVLGRLGPCAAWVIPGARDSNL